MQVELKIPEDIWPRRRDWGGEIVSLYIKEGSEIKAGDVIAEVEIEKAILKILSQYNGKVVKVLVKEGDKVSPGSVIAFIEV
ncbi:biotin/lipoyl-binding protein [Sulfolobus sp. E5-1-F]|uniref:biotin/lipoyl-containing protein n=1 Tax=Sulfolobaceae TaxID=118883 RepID=UPI0012965F6D|nr:MULTISPECIES: biotin/lipoyl-containing protein [unclassified Sulfolobus]QGA55239.1 biotin/lipoyl-binding protein [Sulfolobus sp. E5-1-F]QGA68028.1 biotin/lipoyl-binding protein [Sulfolobus sp. E11-6]